MIKPTTTLAELERLQAAFGVVGTIIEVSAGARIATLYCTTMHVSGRGATETEALNDAFLRLSDLTRAL